MTDHFTDFAIPDTPLTRKTYAFVQETAPQAVLTHSVRSYLFGRAIGERHGLRAEHDYDDEVLFLACILHDAGLIEQGDRGGRFEADGADLAAEFLTGQGLAADRTRLVWDAIALHTSLGIADRMRPEIALTHTGTGADVAAFGAEQLPAGYADRVHAAYPRLGGGTELTDLITGQAARNPAKAPPFSFPAQLLRQDLPGTTVPPWREVVAAAWPGVA
ncbi:hypothetical protein Ppa06_38460 [Planomonospora parontospora subsp. parontospora]|uniref:HD domain-containing protein n=2 Tax=Planomonospora parontospora TaxID=58119 RepID=A0AA37BIQ2_9ACTN|nr:HD domain-containing protein [Planomonospora parontospora]GGK77095.1 hypothetical protein GCM10010126_40450 [Planomonospora parontospora]GII10048.1 hypothetical protein Ppa06_38460 [Planomonospora parontospora subsp. parontospora]